jgi:hypothetical protein
MGGKGVIFPDSYRLGRYTYLGTLLRNCCSLPWMTREHNPTVSEKLLTPPRTGHWRL